MTINISSAPCSAQANNLSTTQDGLGRACADALIDPLHISARLHSVSVIDFERLAKEAAHSAVTPEELRAFESALAKDPARRFDNIESWGPMLTPREPEWLKAATAGKPGHEERYTPEMYRDRAKTMSAAGFDALKFDIDSIVCFTGEELNRPLTNAEIDLMVDCVAAAREGAGPNVDIAEVSIKSLVQ